MFSIYYRWKADRLIFDIDAFYEWSLDRHGVRGLVEELLKLKSVDLDTNIHEIERALPGDESFIRTGYYRNMISRCLYAMEYTSGRNVIDTCCGLGWGSYIVSSNSKRLLAVDISRDALNTCRGTWKPGNIEWRRHDALELDTITEQFDVALAMETVEHFSPEEADIYIRGISESLVQDGVVVGSSSFPESADKAAEICGTNPFHKHVFTRREMSGLLSRYFRKHKIMGGWLFRAWGPKRPH